VDINVSAAMQSTRIIAESLTQWKKVPDAPSISRQA
jgi:hypothetical protein